MATAILEQLQNVAGVIPSNDWLTACRSHLLNTNEDDTVTVTADAILHQVLHADLRDVVRQLHDGGSGIEIQEDPIHSTASVASSAVVLRRAIEESQADSTSSSTTSQRKATLPAHFRLLIQVEELLDISLNAEARLSLGPSSATSPSAVGNQANRTLKMYVSDGHWPHVDMVAMEVSPIANVSANSKAGLKLLLHGPIDIRLGILMLHEGNTTVLGGSVQSMVEIQIKAKEQAQRLAGFGVDPTVKALIWNPDTGMEDEDADEGEGESGDVTRRRITATGTLFGGTTAAGVADSRPVTSAPLHDQSMPPPRSMLPNLYGQPDHPRPQPSSRQAPQNTYGQRARPTAPPQNTYPQPSQTICAAPPLPSPTASSTLTPPPNPPSVTAANYTTYSNPYASKTKMTNANPGAPINNNVAYPRTHNNTTSQSPPDEYSMVDLTQDEPPPILERPHPAECPSSSSQHRRAISFPDLLSLLEQARTDRNVYEAHQSNIFIVQGKMTGPHKYFNIEKNRGHTSKSSSSSSDEKYKYVMVIQFTGIDGGSNNNTITTTVANALSQPYFCLGPTEMRKLSKLHRADADAKAREGGFAVQRALMEWARWEVKLHKTSDEFFSMDPFPSRLDGDYAILELLRKSV